MANSPLMLKAGKYFSLKAICGMAKKSADAESAAYYLEDNQWEVKFQRSKTGEVWVSDHVSHFYWSKDASVACAKNYDDPEGASVRLVVDYAPVSK